MTTSSSAPVAVLGAGGHAKVMVATLKAAGRLVLGCFVREAAELGGKVLGVPVLHEDTVPAGAELILAAGDGRLRQRLAAKLAGPWAIVVHPSAIIDPSVVLEPGAMICAGVVLQPEVRVGAHAIVNTAAHVDHDGAIGRFAHVAPGCHVAGSVAIGEGAFLGTGATVIPGRRIGAWATVGAGAVVLYDVRDGSTVVGVPARERPRP
ncbi:MAG: acetyltransferase [Deltaproteobacteria bacterium]|nr:acetyltransferase [Deltaproteobacteria bacterium]